jgi:pyruvyl transferase EpsO
MKSHSEIMQELKQSHNVIRDLLQGRRFHYIDIPVYDNIGDLLIMQGTMQFFKTHSLTPTTISATAYFKHEWCKPGDVIVFQGGGNFGDLYGNIHAMREKIIAASC